MAGAEHDGCPLFLTFVDFKKAFDSIDREAMFAILRHYGIPAKIVGAIRVLYDNSSAQVYVGGEKSTPFNITTGVLQGDVLAPFLFIIVIDWIMTQLAEKNFGYITHPMPKNEGRTTRRTTQGIEHKISDLDFADDISLIEASLLRAQEQLDLFVYYASIVGLELNVDKTETMMLNLDPNAAPPANLTANGKPIVIVKDFKYLGSYMASTERDVKTRIGLARTAFHRIEFILKAPKLSVKMKMRIFNALIVSILLYGCEAWVLDDKLRKDLDVFARKCYRTMLGIIQSDAHMTNITLYSKVNQVPITTTIRSRQLGFIGHCCRMDTSEAAYIYALYESKYTVDMGIRDKRQTYTHQISQHLWPDKQITLAASEIAKLARDRNGWKERFSEPKQPDR